MIRAFLTSVGIPLSFRNCAGAEAGVMRTSFGAERNLSTRPPTRARNATDTPTFAALVESRRNRPEDFFKTQAGRIDLCNVPIAVRDDRKGK